MNQTETLQATFVHSWRRSLLRQTIIIAFHALAVSCAHVERPRGGPPDTSPPRVEKILPDGNRINILPNEIEFFFNEYLNKQSAQKSVDVSPEIPFESQVSGKSVTVEFKKPLEFNTTYAVSIGTDVQDLSGNKLDSSVAFVFSTGDILDTGAVSGLAVGDSVGGLFVLAFPLSTRDTSSPANAKAKFKTQVGANGSWQLKALPDNDYLLYLLRDTKRNGLYDSLTDEISIATRTIRVDKGKSETTVLYSPPRMLRSDNSLFSIRATDSKTVVADFSLPVDSIYSSSLALTIVDSARGTSMKSKSHFTNPTKSTQVKFILDGSLQPTIKYQASMALLGFADSTVKRELKPVATTDTTPVTLISCSLRDSAFAVSLRPEISFVFSNAIEKKSFNQYLTVVQSATKSTVTPEVSWRFDNNPVVRFNPALQVGGKYRIQLSLAGVESIAGVRSKDTTIILNFSTYDEQQLGTVKVLLQDSLNPDDSSQSYVVKLSGMDKRNSFVQVASKVGEIQFLNVPSGEYTLEAFVDLNRNGVLDVGKLMPSEFCERFAVYSQKLQVRSRWTLDNITLTIR